MTGYEYKWVSYIVGGQFDARASMRAVERGWEPCPVDALPPLATVLDIDMKDTRLFLDWMRNFRLYRMPAETHEKVKAELQRQVDEQLQKEFERFQHSLMAIAGGKSIAEVHAAIEGMEVVF